MNCWYWRIIRHRSNRSYFLPFIWSVPCLLHIVHSTAQMSTLIWSEERCTCSSCHLPILRMPLNCIHYSVLLFIGRFNPLRTPKSADSRIHFRNRTCHQRNTSRRCRQKINSWMMPIKAWLDCLHCSDWDFSFRVFLMTTWVPLADWRQTSPVINHKCRVSNPRLSFVCISNIV